MVNLIISGVVYLATYIIFWLVYKSKKRSEMFTRIASLIALCSIIISSGLTYHELIVMLKIEKGEIVFQAIIYFILIYSFKLFQDYIIDKAE